MSRYWMASLIALLALVLIVPVASARPPIGVHGYFGYGPGYYYGPAFYGGWGWGYPYYPYAGYYGYWGGPTMGSVKIDTKAKSTIVYIDGSYAGTVKDLGTFKLTPGTHNIELRDPSGHQFFQQQVSVVAGKELKIHPNAG